MSGLIRHTALEPFLTGPLLWILLRGTPALRARLLDPLARLPPRLQVTPAGLVSALKWLFAAGVLRRLSNVLSRWALDNWQLGGGEKVAWDWPREVCVVTGGSGGIGSELVKRLAETGMKIAVVDLSPLPASIKSLSNVSFYECDITSQDSVKKVADTIRADLGDPTILCNNAGIGKTYTILDVPASYLEKIFHINLISHWYTVQAFLPGMLKAQKGHIVTTASMASYTSVAGMVDYCATKAGAMSFHEGLTQELKHRYNAPYIRTTAIHPYWVRTALINDWEDQLVRIAPLMTPEYVAGEIAKAILSGRSQHVILPKNAVMNLASGARGWAAWAHQLVNDSTKEVTVENANAKRV